ncbi:MAG: exodeoxyribonuclease III [Euryarchaeota archaeon]|nr:exodeoxyribonuclease III [Euryarchaeota archaeon]
MKLVCWNVNGIRAAYKKGFANWMRTESPDILCVQETKARPEQFPDELREPDGYHAYFCSPKERAGYSGVALYSRAEPNKVEYGLGSERYDGEGRTIVAHYPDFVLFDIYFPNGKASKERLAFKMDFYEQLSKVTDRLLRDGKNVIVCGDVNTAHREIDLARPKENEKVSGFLPEERAWIDRFLSLGLIDTYRNFDPSPGKYTWWDMKTKARERDVGWRIDYFYISKGLQPRLRAAFIRSDVLGSDHCPIGIELDL